MKYTLLCLAAVLTLPLLAQADETGPTHPKPSREHPLDIREPREDVIRPPRQDRRVPSGADDTLAPTLDRPSMPMDRPAGRTSVSEAGSEAGPPDD